MSDSPDQLRPSLPETGSTGSGLPALGNRSITPKSVRDVEPAPLGRGRSEQSVEPVRERSQPSSTAGGGSFGRELPSVPGRLWRRLRGHWWWLLTLSALAAGTAGTAGYGRLQPIYKAEAEFRFVAENRPAPTLLPTAGAAGSTPAVFDPFVETQLSLLMSRPMIEGVLANKEWQPCEVDSGRARWTAEDFQAAVRIERTPPSEVVRLVARDTVPARAAAAVRLLLQEFESTDRRSSRFHPRLKSAEDALAKLSGELEARRGDITALVRRDNTDDIKGLITSEKARRLKLEGEYDAQRRELERRRGIRRRADALRALPPEQLATYDERLRGLLAERGKLEADWPESVRTAQDPAAILAVSDARCKELDSDVRKTETEIATLLADLGEKHPLLVPPRNRLADLKRRLEDRRGELRAGVEAVRARLAKLTELINEEAVSFRKNIDLLGPQLLDAEVPSEPDLAARAAEVARLNEELAGLDRRLAVLAADDLTLSDLRQRVERLTQQEQEARVALERARGELGPTAGLDRVSPPTELATVAARPEHDPRPLAAGAAGAAAGMTVLLLGVLGVLTLRRPRLRYADDWAALVWPTPVVAVVPQADRGDDPTADAVLANAIGELRGLLENMPGSRNGRVLAVVGPGWGTRRGGVPVGDGRTFLSVGLGVAFAEAEMRTLLVDLDFGGQGLSDLFVVPEPSAASSESPDPAWGLAAYVAGRRRLLDCVLETSEPNLFVLPISDRADDGFRGLRRDTLSQVLADARQWFDLILLDTGRRGRTAEVLTAAQLANAVICVAARGTPEGLAEELLTKLTEISVEPVAAVFNRAREWPASLDAIAAEPTAEAGRGRGRRRPTAEARRRPQLAQLAREGGVARPISSDRQRTLQGLPALPSHGSDASHKSAEPPAESPPLSVPALPSVRALPNVAEPPAPPKPSAPPPKVPSLPAASLPAPPLPSATLPTHDPDPVLQAESVTDTSAELDMEGPAGPGEYLETATDVLIPEDVPTPTDLGSRGLSSTSLSSASLSSASLSSDILTADDSKSVSSSQLTLAGQTLSDLTPAAASVSNQHVPLSATEPLSSEAAMSVVLDGEEFALAAPPRPTTPTAPEPQPTPIS